MVNLIDIDGYLLIWLDVDNHVNLIGYLLIWLITWT